MECLGQKQEQLSTMYCYRLADKDRTNKELVLLLLSIDFGTFISLLFTMQISSQKTSQLNTETMIDILKTFSFEEVS